MNKEIIKNAIFLNGKKCDTKQNLFSYFSKKLDFPDYFGNNWDSLEEIINDLTPKENVIIYNYEYCLKNDSENLKILNEILNQYNNENENQFLFLTKF